MHKEATARGGEIVGIAMQNRGELPGLLGSVDDGWLLSQLIYISDN